ncbi:MAG: tetratricopeptide repeat protein [Candidatus Omnitrophica bacterium]|nr:tetratricopeptide repeat protein [Candidatus Omnitrophota bacterium]
MKPITGLKLNPKHLLVCLLAVFLVPSFLVSPCFSKSRKNVTKLYSDYLNGLHYFQRGEYETALDSFRAAKDKDPDSVHLSLKLAAALIRLERMDEAEEVLLKAKKADPDNLDISLVLIFIYSLTHDDQQLEVEYENFLKKAHELKPKDLGISEYLAQFYFYKNKPTEAIKVYEKILESNPNHVGAIFWLGYLYDESGRRKEAIDVWKKGLAIDESHAPILNSLGYVYTLEGENLDQAKTMIEKALEQEPENGAYLDSLGWVYFKLGNLEKAKEYLEKAIANIKDPEIFEHLGDLYAETGEPAKGLEYYKEGLAHFPNHSSLKKKIERYEK